MDLGVAKQSGVLTRKEPCVPLSKSEIHAHPKPAIEWVDCRVSDVTGFCTFKTLHENVPTLCPKP